VDEWSNEYHRCAYLSLDGPWENVSARASLLSKPVLQFQTSTMVP
jgi:hypothetical protein